MGTTVDIKNAVFGAISGVASVAWPNVPYEGNTPYVRPHIMPAMTDTVGLSGIDHHMGIIQVDCVVATGGGEIEASALADTVIALFPRGARFTSGSTTVQINKASWASSGQQSPNIYFVPVTIPYEVIK